MIGLESSFESRLARDYLQAIGKRLEDLMPMLRKQLEYYKTVAQPAIFAAHAGGKNGGSGHPAWQNLSPYYLASDVKRSSAHPKDILRLSGAFAADLTTGTGETIEIERIGSNDAEIIFGSGRAYPRFVGAGQGGSRQAMYVTGDAAKAMTDIANHFLSAAIVAQRSATAQRLKP